jgi:hypothetical protein
MTIDPLRLRRIASNRRFPENSTKLNEERDGSPSEVQVPKFGARDDQRWLDVGAGTL